MATPVGVSGFQTSFFAHQFPSTRFQGSKAKLAPWIMEKLQRFSFSSALDAFGGTGAIAYALKAAGKKVTYNDLLKFNYLIGVALIENSSEHLSGRELDELLGFDLCAQEPGFISKTFGGIYYTDEENLWLDSIIPRIQRIESGPKKAIAYFGLFQACLVKRPFNLFHRNNLYIRFADVRRNFGNKATWDKSFEEHFRNFVQEANEAVFDNGEQNHALNLDALEIPGNYDLVYIDTPYLNKSGIGVDYLHFYHFLEGVADFANWPSRVNHGTKHKRLKPVHDAWGSKNTIYDAYDRLLSRFRNSILVVSYRSDGIPTEQELVSLVRKYKTRVDVFRSDYKYVLSTNSESRELLLIAS